MASFVRSRVWVLAVVIGGVLLAAVLAGEKTAQPITPTEVIPLFNGKDLTGLYTWLKDAKYEDPRQVFRVTDGMLHITGEGLGGIITRNEYRDYHMLIEFKWGPRTWEPRKDRAKDSGLLVHCNGPDGGYNDTWMTSIEAQIIEGGCGDFILVRGKDADGKDMLLSLTAEVTKDRDGETVWKKGGEKQTFNRGRINWYGRDPDWADKLGFRGKNDVESPDGQWTRMEVICDGGTITNIVNGVVVNQGFDAQPSSGKILLQTELAELFVRRWELRPLQKAD